MLFSPELQMCKENGNRRVERNGTTRSQFSGVIN